ncbi:TatD family hydrolase [Wielerella bovis]|uniref:TatD family hydrolase n=1 Tax=Wielerella bovis TaxID=2917790 RepID=UPI0020188592|nr:TatD family hydrolase [Wielerella bovis]ULJ63353.1 TatD family hydrolase [Wielerella bovis]
MFTDTHCHLIAPELRFRLPEIVAQAAAVGVTGLLVPSASIGDWDAILQLRQPEIRAVAIGVHPWFADEWRQETEGSLKQILQQNTNAWVGEIGLDFLHDTPRETQVSVFRLQLQLAQQFSRPIIVHNVKASAALADIIRAEKFTCGGIIHAFSGSLEEARVFIRHSFKIGIGSLLLNPRAKKVRIAAQSLPLNSIVLETDSPYMQPENRNTPANIRQIAEIVADLRGISVQDLAAACEENWCDLMAKSS